jgi:hypothetical protein
MKRLLPLAVFALLGCGSGPRTGGDGGLPRSDGGTVHPGPITGSGAFLPPGSFIYEDISESEPRADSDAITAWMVDYTEDEGTGSHGFGSGTSELRINFSIVVNHAASGTAEHAFDTDDDYYYPPDCDLAPMPLPAGGSVELTDGVTQDFSTALSGYECAGFDDGDDCHLIVFAPFEHRLYEIYHATVRGNGDFIGGCQAVWPTDVVPPADGRGQHCTSADAGGFPIAPMLFTADEIAAGEIDHAIRFILPNPMIIDRRYVAPATHATHSGGPLQAVPYGARFRLRSDFPVSSLDPGAQVIARALQRYGMILADGGQITLTAESDIFAEHTWEEVGVGDYSLSSIDATDFEIIDTGASVYDTWDCERAQITD